MEAFRGNAEEWDSFVRSTRHWTHYHLFGWKRVVETVFGHECAYLAARLPSGELVGILPLVTVRSRLFGRYLVSMPFLNAGGPLGSAEAVSALTQHARRILEEERSGFLELRARHELPLRLPVSHRKITVFLDLPDDGMEPLWRGLSSKVRSQIRRPRKEGAIARFGLQEIDAFFDVFSRHMRDLGTPTQSRQLFETIAAVFPETVRFGCVYLSGRPVAVGCGVGWNGEFELCWASSLREYNASAPNMLLYWRFIEVAIDEGARLFNFGRCTPGGGGHRFKRQWGGRDETLWWYYQGRGRNGGVPSREDPAHRWKINLWRRLPLALTNRLGPRIVRSLP